MAQIEGGARSGQTLASSPQQKPPIPGSRPLQALVNKSKDMATTIHDFLSLAGRSPTETEDLLQPFENARASGFLPHGSTVGTGEAGMEYAVQVGHAIDNKNLDLVSNMQCKGPVDGPMEGRKERLENVTLWLGMPPKCRISDTGHLGKLAQGGELPVDSTRWAYQQQASLEESNTSRTTSKVLSEEGKDEDEDEDEDDEILDQSCKFKRETMCFPRSGASLKSEGKISDLKASKPRSKHSATEQRRRSKINDRLQVLRQLLPNADQKRDKASFLLEVIGYIQMLQEKVKKYENGKERRVQERMKVIPMDALNSTCRDSTASSTYLALPSAVTFDAKDIADSNGYLKRISSPLRVMSESDGNLTSWQGSALPTHPPQGSQACASRYQEPNMAVSQSMSLALSNMQNAPFERISIPSFHPSFSSSPQPTVEVRTMLEHLVKYDECQSMAEAKKSLSKLVEAIPQISNAPCPSQRPPEEDTILRRENTERNLMLENGKQIIHFAESLVKKGVQPEPLVIHGGRIKVSGKYSEKLLDSLRQALQTAGIDLTQASISVQVDVAKPGAVKDSSPRKVAVPRKTETAELEQTRKRQKMEVDG